MNRKVASRGWKSLGGICVLVCALVFTSRAGLAQTADGSGQTAAVESKTPLAQAGNPLDLDALLKLSPKGEQKGEQAKPQQLQGGAQGTLPTTGQQRLDRALDVSKEQVADDELVSALLLMGQSAARLKPQDGQTSDASLATQRLQQEAIAKLDQLIGKARKQQQKSCSNPKDNCDNPSESQQAGKSQKQGDAQKMPQNAQGQEQSQPAQSKQSQQTQSAGTNENVSSPGDNTVQQNRSMEVLRASWGNLPERVRQALIQGSGDSFSKEYQRLTEEYYKRLGEKK
jgi:hypothetical protein